MKKNISVIFFLIVLLSVSIWLIRGYKIGKKEIEEEKIKEIKGKVTSVYKPEGNKIIHIIFADGTEYAPSFFGLNNLVNVGDSIFKEPNSFKFIIYKNSNPNDSVIYIGENRFY